MFFLVFIWIGIFVELFDVGKCLLIVVLVVFLVMVWVFCGDVDVCCEGCG